MDVDVQDVRLAFIGIGIGIGIGITSIAFCFVTAYIVPRGLGRSCETRLVLRSKFLWQSHS